MWSRNYSRERRDSAAVRCPSLGSSGTVSLKKYKTLGVKMLIGATKREVKGAEAIP